jgi:hypothetical protein
LVLSALVGAADIIAAFLPLFGVLCHSVISPIGDGSVSFGDIL